MVGGFGQGREGRDVGRDALISFACIHTCTYSWHLYHLINFQPPPSTLEEVARAKFSLISSNENKWVFAFHSLAHIHKHTQLLFIIRRSRRRQSHIKWMVLVPPFPCSDTTTPPSLSVSEQKSSLLSFNFPFTFIILVAFFRLLFYFGKDLRPFVCIAVDKEMDRRGDAAAGNFGFTHPPASINLDYYSSSSFTHFVAKRGYLRKIRSFSIEPSVHEWMYGCVLLGVAPSLSHPSLYNLNNIKFAALANVIAFAFNLFSFHLKHSRTDFSTDRECQIIWIRFVEAQVRNHPFRVHPPTSRAHKQTHLQPTTNDCPACHITTLMY